jgi:hypothetical protein
MHRTRIREHIAKLIAIVVVLLVASVGAALFGWNVPVLSAVGHALGVGK